MSTKAIVLSSGGLDSTTCLAKAVTELGRENVTALAFSYGQKHDKELEASLEVAGYYQVEHKTIDLSTIFQGSNCALLKDSTQEISHQSYEEQIEETGEVNTYVPFRNGTMLAIAASVALSKYPKDNVEIWIGVHADDVGEDRTKPAYPDCSNEFIDSMFSAIFQGTYYKVTIVSPFVTMSKADIVQEGLRLKVPYELTWSCYEGGEKPCGKCATCLDRQNAFEQNGVVDPALK